jgi:hypothetical protein
MRRSMHTNLGRNFFVALALFLFPLETYAQTWVATPQRWGNFVPTPRQVAVALEGGGAIARFNLGNVDATATLGRGTITWNLALWPWFCVIGQHAITHYSWSNVRMLTLGDEVGVRIIPFEKFSIQALYLGHRLEQEWIDDKPFAIGGVRDHGVELGTAYQILFDRLSVEPQAIIRYFKAFRDDYAVVGAGVRLALRLTDGQELVSESTLLENFRIHPHTGLPAKTTNALGELRWQMELIDRLAIQVGARASRRLLVGVEPMLELRISMVNEPLGMGFVAVSYTF